MGSRIICATNFNPSDPIDLNGQFNLSIVREARPFKSTAVCAINTKPIKRLCHKVWCMSHFLFTYDVEQVKEEMHMKAWFVFPRNKNVPCTIIANYYQVDTKTLWRPLSTTSVAQT